jgi:hypothetical protein
VTRSDLWADRDSGKLPPRKGVPPLNRDGDQFHLRPDSPESEAPIDLPLREHAPAEEPAPLRASGSDPGDDQRGQAPFTVPARAGGNGFAIGMLVLGLLVGFGGGFVVGQRLAVPLPLRAVGVPRPAPVDEARDALGDSRAAPLETTSPVQLALPPPAAPVQDVPELPAIEAPVLVQEPEVKAPRPAPKPRPAPPVVKTGTVRFDSRPPGATIYLDEVRVGITPLTVTTVTPGPHQVRMEMLGHDTWRSTVTVKEGEQHFVGASIE